MYSVSLIGVWVNGAVLAMTLYLVVSGIDDLCLFLAWFWFLVRERGRVAPSASDLSGIDEARLAVFVPLWQEEGVVRQMVTHNVTAVRYRRVDFFIGGYPNDIGTVEAIRGLEARFGNVHLALTPHDGPTSKADCLNWIYQAMLVFEDQAGVRFDAILTHDAEDMIHPEAFRWTNWYLRDYDMVQVPVLALPTPVLDWVHGIYVDEFAEFQSRDLFVRCRMGGFLPSCGVGTAYSRRAMERMAVSAENRIFEPGCLTEDYENGFRVKLLGFRQILLPSWPVDGESVATREYFPRTWSTAVKQRTRWVTGIAWQGLERHGWQGGVAQWWWHWRDRKGLIGNPVGFLANLLFLYGFVGFLRGWRLDFGPSPVGFLLFMAGLQMSARAVIVQRHYGWKLGVTAPLRVPLANALNAVAGWRATVRYWRSRWRGEPLVWLKTAHQYPNRMALEAYRPTLQEVLVQSGYCGLEELKAAIGSKPAGMRLEDWLVRRGSVTEAELYEAMSLQWCVPVSELDPTTVPLQVARSLPAAMMREYGVIPIARVGGELVVAAAEMPPEAVQARLRAFTSLPLRFTLVRRTVFEAVAEVVLPG